MNTRASSTGRSSMALRLRNDLVSVIKQEAKREHRSLNNYIENLLIRYFNVDEKVPNAATIAAIEEAKAGKCTGRIDTSSMEAFIQSSEE
ncbi:MAG: toxin-antitoxin system protein [Tannerella sp.]|nr:toxin-antitoxin system protein [Tannerella sp.]